MKEFKHLVNVFIEDNDESYTKIFAELDVCMQYLVGYWYIVKSRDDERNDYLFVGNKKCLYVEDSGVEGIGTKSNMDQEGVILQVYGDYEITENKDDITKELI